MALPDEYELLYFYNESQPRRRWLWRYAPIAIWIGLTFWASTEQFSSDNTDKVFRPLLVFLFPDLSRDSVEMLHGAIRKAAHVLEYAVLAGLLARALLGSWTPLVRRHWMLLCVTAIVVLALADEFHQSFVPNRTSTIYDSLIDVCGGLAVLLPIWLFHKLLMGHMSETRYF